MLMKAQPLAYNKDNQEDKEPLFDTVDTLVDSLAIMADLVAHAASPSMPDACAPPRAKALPPRPTSPTTWCAGAARFATRTKPWRAPSAMPSRKAATWPICRRPSCGSFRRWWATTSHESLTLEGSVASRNHPGGTAPEQVRLAISAARRELGIP